MHLFQTQSSHSNLLAILLIVLFLPSIECKSLAHATSGLVEEPLNLAIPDYGRSLRAQHDIQEEERLLLLEPQPHRDDDDDVADETGYRHSREQGLVKRAPKVILNNTPEEGGLRVDQTLNYEFQNPHSTQALQRDVGEEDDSLDTAHGDDLELRKRQRKGQRPRHVYITINTCSQPDYASKADKDEPPQLTLYISTSAQHSEPGPHSQSDDIISRTLFEGFASVQVRTDDNVYIGVSSPKVDVVNNGIWTYFVAGSIDEPYHSFVNSSLNLFMIDSDRNAALLITKNLSSAAPDPNHVSQWLDRGPPFSIYVQETNNTAISGLRRSYCGIDMTATLPGFEVNPIAVDMETGLTTYGGSALEQQFYIPGLNATSTYYGILARPSNPGNKPGGGGAIYVPMTFHTKLQANCLVVFNLTFCSSIAYAVPANPATYANVQELTALYDSTTAQKYQNFNYSLQQVACNTTATAQYSLNKTCDDCAAAYKQWLCAVSIPRCTDWEPDPAAAGAAYLQPRNAAQHPIAATPDIARVTEPNLLDWLATNSSRNNATIAGLVQPGPYAEILPCEDLCYELIRACPASFGFGCPYAGRGLESSYGVRNLDVRGVSCSEPGAVFGLSGAAGLRGSGWAALACAVAVVAAVLR